MFHPGRALRRAIMVVLVFGGGAAMAIEKPAYEVLERYADFELRRYESSLVAATEVGGDLEQAGRTAFGILADYIFGNNRGRTKIEMTAPVNQQQAGERIEMTAPVAQQPSTGTADRDRYVVTFVMPTRFTLETLPTPGDPRVQIREVPPRLMAVRRYSGRWTEANYREHETILLQAVREAGLTPIGAPVYARYDPPFKPWFLRRNEVQVEVAEPESR